MTGLDHSPKISWSHENARDLVAQGYSLRAAARAMGVHASTVMRALRRGGAAKNGRAGNMDLATLIEIVRRRVAGETLAQIAAATGRHEGTVYNWLARIGEEALTERVSLRAHCRRCDAEMVAANLDAGGYTAIARELGDGWNRSRVTRAAKAAGLPVQPGKRVETLRRMAEEMPPREAVAMLLDEYEMIVGEEARIGELCLAGLTQQQAAIYAALEAAGGRPVAKDRLYSILAAGRPDYEADPKYIDTVVFQLRRRIHNWPARIVTVRGFGYRLIIKEQDI